MRNLYKQAKGISSTATIAIVAIIIAGIIIAMVMMSGDTPFSPTNPPSDSGGCELAPTISPVTVNAINKGTAVTSTMYARVNGVYKGAITSSTSFSKGDKVELKFNASNFIDVIHPNILTLGCGANAVEDELYATSTNTFRLFNTAGNALTDATCASGATNQTSSASPITIDMRIDSTVDESTGDLVVVVEATNTTEIDTISLSGPGVTTTTVPEFYSVAGAGSIAKAFSVPELLDGASQQYTLVFGPETGITMGTGADGVGTSIYVTAYSKQAFTDVDGTFIVGVEDSDGTNKYEDTWDFDFCIYVS